MTRYEHSLASIAIATCVLILGCGSGRDAKLKEDRRRFELVAKGAQDQLQWKLDDEVASSIFGLNDYMTFRKCHDEPPTHDANKKTCVALQSRVANREAKDHEKATKDKANW